MRKIILALTLVICTTSFLGLRAVTLRADEEALPVQDAKPESFFDLQTRTLEGEELALQKYQGQVILVVNVASKCGLTPQYAGLETLFRELSSRGFVIMGFPSSDFLNQEPGSPAEIRTFCETNYDITFPMFEKVHVIGEQKCEVYQFLTRDQEDPTWNFTKYLVDREGKVIQRFDPRTKPDDPDLREALELELDS